MKIYNIQNNVLTVVEVTTVQLQSSEAITVSSLSSNSTSETTSLDLRANGVRSPNQAIGRINKKGAWIEPEVLDSIDSNISARDGGVV
jgi:hypothetical protein